MSVLFERQVRTTGSSSVRGVLLAWTEGRDTGSVDRGGNRLSLDPGPSYALSSDIQQRLWATVSSVW